MRRICVYCGSRSGRGAGYVEAGCALAECLASRSIGLVYGGASVGLMGALADAMLQAGGEVIGVLPRDLADREIAHPGVSELRLVESMHERKAVMAELSDGFIALPGGLGTLEEIFEILTWAQLGLHAKPCGLLNVGGYYDKLVTFLDHAVDEGFLKAARRSEILIENDPATLLDAFEAFRPMPVPKWIKPASS